VHYQYGSRLTNSYEHIAISSSNLHSAIPRAKHIVAATLRRWSKRNWDTKYCGFLHWGRNRGLGGFCHPHLRFNLQAINKELQERSGTDIY